MKLFLSPHNDDETLFGSFTIQREKPLVVVVFDSFVQAERGNRVTFKQRRLETINAVGSLEAGNEAAARIPLEFAGLRDNQQYEIAGLVALLKHLVWPMLDSLADNIEQVWAPAIEKGGHDQHNLVGLAADLLWPGKVTHYLTYTREHGKSTSANRVVVESGDWIRRKLCAMACYDSQINIEALGCRPHFMRDLYEYYE